MRYKMDTSKRAPAVRLLACGLGGALLLAGCNSGTDLEQPAMETVEVEQLKGSSFAQPAATPAPVVADAAPPADGEGPVAHATASDIPADISKIPSATPVPRPTVSGEVAGGNPAPQPPSPPIDPGSYQTVSFQKLASFKYVEPIPKEGAKPEETEAQRLKDQIPAEIKTLNGKKVAVEGWMVPMQVDDDGGVKSFVLVNTQPECCFGDTQSMNEWIDVTMPGGQKAEFNVDRPIMVSGSLEVGEKMEDGFVLSIFRMTADRVGG